MALLNVKATSATRLLCPTSGPGFTWEPGPSRSESSEVPPSWPASTSPPLPLSPGSGFPIEAASRTKGGIYPEKPLMKIRGGFSFSSRPFARALPAGSWFLTGGLPGNSVELQLPARPTPLCSSARSSPPACLFGEHCVPRSYAVKPLGHSAGSRVRTRPLRKVVEEFLSDLAAWVFLLTHPFSAFLVQAGLREPTADHPACPGLWARVFHFLLLGDWSQVGVGKEYDSIYLSPFVAHALVLISILFLAVTLWVRYYLKKETKGFPVWSSS